jgi:hypothetical protein
VPADIAFQTKPEIALAQLRAARSTGLSAVGAFSSLLVWRPGETPPPRTEGGRGPRRKACATRPRPIQVKVLATELPADAW